MQFIGKKAAYALSQNLKLIACIGELLEEREAGKTFDVCFKQMKAFAGCFFYLIINSDPIFHLCSLFHMPYQMIPYKVCKFV